jgi:hypothetical protein
MLFLEDLREDDPRPTRLPGEPFHHGSEWTLEDVVREQDAAAVAADEALSQPERLRNAARPLLVCVEEPLNPVLLSIAQQSKELPRVGAAGDQHQFREPGLHERLNGIRDHRAVVQRQQVLVRDARERGEPAA